MAENVYQQYSMSKLPADLDIQDNESDPCTETDNIDKNGPINFKWTDDKVKLLINIRLSMENEFSNPKVKKMKLWDKVAKQFNEISNCNRSANEMNEKYRNLLQTYRKNKEKQKHTGEGRIKWDFFEEFDNVLGHKASSMPSSDNLGSSLTSDDDSDQQHVKKQKKSDKGLTVNEYLLWKKQMKLEKERREQQKWQEKKELKVKELEVLRDLVNVLQKEKNEKTQRDSSKDND